MQLRFLYIVPHWVPNTTYVIRAQGALCYLTLNTGLLRINYTAIESYNDI